LEGDYRNQDDRVDESLREERRGEEKSRRRLEGFLLAAIRFSRGQTARVQEYTSSISISISVLV
jgi:hypothetical protein